MKKIGRHSLIIIKLVILLLFTVNDAEFEFRPFFEKILNESFIMRLVALYVLCLTYIVSAEEKITMLDFADALLSTGFFLLFINPRNITKSITEQGVTSISLDKLSGT